MQEDREGRGRHLIHLIHRYLIHLIQNPDNSAEHRLLLSLSKVISRIIQHTNKLIYEKCKLKKNNCTNAGAQLQNSVLFKRSFIHNLWKLLLTNSIKIITKKVFKNEKITVLVKLFYQWYNNKPTNWNTKK